MNKHLFNFLLAIVVGVLCWSSSAFAQKTLLPLHEYEVKSPVDAYDSLTGKPVWSISAGHGIFLLDSTAALFNGMCVRRKHYAVDARKILIWLIPCDMLEYKGMTMNWQDVRKTSYEYITIDTVGMGAIVARTRAEAAKPRAEAAIARFKTQPGFKQFRLGMSRADVEDIALTSNWVFTPTAGGKGGDLWVQGVKRYFGGVVDAPPDDQSLLEIRCENSDCTYPAAIELRFFGDTLSAIRLKGHTMDKSSASLTRSWADEMTQALQVPYGKPAHFNKKLDDVDYDQIQHLPQGTYELSAWTLKNGVSIQVAMVSGDPSQEEPFGSYCLITDGRAEKPTAATAVPEKKSKKTNSGF